MKKLIYLLFCVSFLMTGHTKAQDATFKPDEFYKSFTGIVDGDTIKGTAEMGKVFYVNKPFQYVFNYEVSATKVFDGGSINLIISGSNNGIKYYPLDTISWGMATADTSVLFTVSSGVMWRFLKGSIKGVGATTRAKLGNQHLRVAEYK